MELQGVAAINAMGFHPSLEGPQSPAIEVIELYTVDRLYCRLEGERSTGSWWKAGGGGELAKAEDNEITNLLCLQEERRQD